MIITLNKPNKTISIHKDNCKTARAKLGDVDLSKYPNGYQTGNNDNQIWFSEKHFSIQKAQIFFKNGDYGKIFCQRCF